MWGSGERFPGRRLRTYPPCQVLEGCETRAILRDMSAAPDASQRPVPRLTKVLRNCAELLAAPRLLVLGIAAAVLQALLLVPIGPLVAYVFDDVLPDRDRGALVAA